jgi:AraC-like DNA-binding protein
LYKLLIFIKIVANRGDALKTEEQKLEQSFNLLQKILSESFHIDSNSFTYPYADLSKIDHGIRNMMWDNFAHTEQSGNLISLGQDQQFLIIRSNLGFYNMLVFPIAKEHSPFISIGPFRAGEFTLKFFTEIIKILPLSIESIASLKNIYEKLPYVELATITNITKCIINEYFEGFENLTPSYIIFSEETQTLSINLDRLEILSTEALENYQKTLLSFLDKVRKGKTDDAQKILNIIIKDLQITVSDNLSSIKRNINMLNDYCYLALLETNVHPNYSLKLYINLRNKIDNTNSQKLLADIAGDICRKYCMLVKNYSLPEYSKTVRDVINYIHLHIENELTLSVLADYLGRNASTLSASFSKEIGMSITNFIHKSRINEAIRYFNTTRLSISEVSIAVGFQDFSYFSKIFKKYIGCSPREYCKNIQRN